MFLTNVYINELFVFVVVGERRRIEWVVFICNLFLYISCDFEYVLCI